MTLEEFLAKRAQGQTDAVFISRDEAKAFTTTASYFYFRASIVDLIKNSNIPKDRQAFILTSLGGIFTILTHGFTLSSARKDFTELLKINTNDKSENEIVESFINGLQTQYDIFRTKNPLPSKEN